VDALAKQLRADGYEATPVVVDVSARESVAALATKAEELGDVRSVVHTAGLSPEQASADAILAVDLLGVALVLEEFAEVIAPGGAGVVIASMAGHLYPDFPAEQAQQLATTPADELLDLPFVAAIDNSAVAYGFAKQANLVRVQAANTRWGVRGARVNSISPGVIATPMGQAELDGENAAVVRMLVDSSNAKRVGTTAEIAEAVEFLLGAKFVSGTDLLVDGGVTAAVRSQR
jgi:NAD(P)-dependent dehydrogenase (short-subunit alcohol dehydrogenase family)